MKCYHCGGQTFAHKAGCPDIIVKKVTAETLVKKAESELPKNDSDILSNQYWRQPKQPVRTYISFMPLEHSQVAAESINSISNQPQVVCRIQRLWIDESISGFFMIRSIRITHMETLLCGGEGRIFGNLFRSGRWPLTEKADSVFGIDLSGWPTISPAHRVQVTIENISLGAVPFRGCFEILCVS